MAIVLFGNFFTKVIELIKEMEQLTEQWFQLRGKLKQCEQDKIKNNELLPPDDPLHRQN